MSDNFQVTQKFELISHEPGKAYPISVKEWVYLKEQIARIEERANVWHTIGSILLGAAGSALLNALTATFPAPSVGSSFSIPEVINWAFFFTTGICGALSFCFGRSHSKFQKELAQDVVKQMALIEGRFQKDGVSALSVNRPVVFGQTMKLKHFSTTKLLSSCEKNHNHPKSSRQQMVFAVSTIGPNEMWIVKAQHGQQENYREGKTIQNGDFLRVEHASTRKNLHSHAVHPSPITAQQEVTAIGVNGVHDPDDNWKIEVEGGGEWFYNKRIKLIHVNTNNTLHSHNSTKPPLLEGNQEVTCYSGRDDNDWWVAEP
jgi:dolichyl-phosphate-mannose--protein O-mannosyl transferase